MALSIQGTPAAAAATSVALPTHAAGDIIVFVAYKDGATTIPSVPAAGGTVPTWNTIDGPTGANTNAMVACWALATANNHTSGTWTGATGVFAIVYRGQSPSPIGGHTQAGGTGANTCLAPAITLSKTDGTSAIVHIGGARNVTAWGAMGAGYTNRANVATEIRGATKDTTTSDGSQTLVPTNANSGSGYRAQTVEILVAAPISKTLGVAASTEAAQALAKTQASQSKTLTPKTETNTAQALAKTQAAQTKTLGVPTSANNAQALTKTQQAQTRTLGVTTSAEAAQALTFQLEGNPQFVSIAAALETSAARTVTASQSAQTKTIAAATTTAQAQPILFTQQPISRTLGVAATADAARPLGASQTPLTATLGAATETGVAQPAAFTQAPTTQTLSFAVESDFAWPLQGPGGISRTLLPGTETSAAQPLSFNQTATSASVVAAVETSTAVHLRIEGELFGVGTAGQVNPHSTRGHLEHSITGRLVN